MNVNLDEVRDMPFIDLADVERYHQELANIMQTTVGMCDYEPVALEADKQEHQVPLLVQYLSSKDDTIHLLSSSLVGHLFSGLMQLPDVSNLLFKYTSSYLVASF